MVYLMKMMSGRLIMMMQVMEEYITTEKMMTSTFMNMILRHFIWLNCLLFSLSSLMGQEVEDTLSLDLDNLWDNYKWEEIEEVTDVYFEVEQITPVAGVRGSEAKYEIFKYLYYRKSMRKNNKKRK